MRGIIVLILVAVSLLVAVDAQSTPARTAVGEIQTTAKNISRTYRSIRPAGRISDTTEQIWSLRDRNGNAIGRLLLGCRWASPAARLCTGVVRMPLGTIAVNGESETQFSGVFAVVGGTGFYRSSGGEARFTAIGRNRMIFTIELG